MKNTKLKGVIVFLAMVILFSACNKAVAQTSGGRSFSNGDDLKKYLDSQPANSPDKPIKVAMKVNEPMFKSIVGVINNAGKYVSLDLSGSPTTTIPDEAFQGCISLVSITIPDGVTSIGDEAFQGCKSLTDVTIPNKVTSIGYAAFNGCTSLTSITIPFVGTELNSSSSDYLGYIFGAGDDDDGGYYVPKTLKTVIITGGTGIGVYAFYGCSSITSVTIPSSVTKIEESAFERCTGLTSITFQGTIPSSGIDSDAFKGLGDLRGKYLSGGRGTYTRTSGSNTWTKQ